MCAYIYIYTHTYMSTQEKVSCINVSKGVVHCLYERIQDSKIFMFHMLKKRKKKFNVPASFI